MPRKRAQHADPVTKPRHVRAGMFLAAAGVLAVCIVVRYYWAAEPATAGAPRLVRPPVAAVRPVSGAQPRQASEPPANTETTASELRIVATVNGEEITRAELVHECVKHYGEAVLESVVNKYLIMEECRRRRISVSQAEVDAEIERIATRFGLPVRQWLEMLERERGIKPRQYANDIIWPTVALQKLAGQRLKVTEAELLKQYEAQYGPSVQARLIVCDDRRAAERVRAEAMANPQQFGTLAKNESVDAASASLNGRIQPIRKHIGHKEIEEVAFQMAEGEISPVIQVGSQYAILKCEGQLPARRIAFEQVKMNLLEMVRNAKMRQVAQEIFRELQKKASVVNVLNDPDHRRQMPGVAALINGQKIEERELAELCFERHGEEVLEGTINRRLLEQACKKRNIVITDQDIDREIARAASLYVEPKEDGAPNVERWLEVVTREQSVSVEVYRSDSVWPSVALKKLVEGQVEVTEEDLRRGYEANYGPRVRCLAIVLNDLRRAQRVWAMANNRPTAEYFGDLAEQYSVEASSRALRGEVPPIQRHGGQPKLEEAAFALKKGELSGIIQVSSDKYVILFCEGRTELVGVAFDEVRSLIYEDVYEKKLRIAMAEYFEQLQRNAAIDNYLAGTSRSPRQLQPSRRPSGASLR